MSTTFHSAFPDSASAAERLTSHQASPEPESSQRADRRATAFELTLSGVRLPRKGPRRRDVRPPHRQTPNYLSHYDVRTLFYDCVYQAEPQRFTLTCPRLLNLWPVLRDGLRDEHGPLRGRLRRRQWLRCEQIEWQGTYRPYLMIDYGGIREHFPVRQSLAPFFAGRNALVAVNKNNALHWIADWARYHQRAHGADAVVLFDNASTAYTLEAIRTTLEGIPGLTVVAVIASNYPYGPFDPSGRFDISPRFFQTSMLNIARRDMLSAARAVLSCDIDELVLPLAGSNVFDRTRQSVLGVTSFPGFWAYPEPHQDGPQPHEAHVFVKPGRPFGKTKWCVAPDRFYGRFGWSVHRFGPFFPLSRQRDITFMHCRATSTSWKKDRRSALNGVRFDPGLHELVQTYLSARGSERAPSSSS